MGVLYVPLISCKIFINDTKISGGIMNKEKLTEHELLKRLDNEFDDVDFRITDCATKGVVATVYFYEKKLENDGE